LRGARNAATSSNHAHQPRPNAQPPAGGLSDHQPEPGYEKIVIYGAYGEWEHAARLLSSGKWTSKLGPDEDIEHDSPQDLAGGAFGLIVRTMKRPVAVKQQAPAAPPTAPMQPAPKRKRRKR